MYWHFETLNSDGLFGLVTDYAADVPPQVYPSLYKGLTREVRGVRQVIPKLLVDVALIHTSHSAKTRLRQSKLASALLGFPAPSGSIMILDLEQPQRSREIHVYPEKQDPLTVIEGDMATGNIEHLMVREPNATDLRLVNAVIKELGN